LATELLIMRGPGGSLLPATDDARETVGKWKLGDHVMATIRRVRDPVRHRRFFAMLDLGYESWEPPAAEYRGQIVQKNRERFRKDCLILAGFADPVVNMKGEVRMEAKSMAFGSMDQDEFEKVYSAVANVILQRVLTNYTRDDLDSVVEKMLRF
jgi:hypothetical protein